MKNPSTQGWFAPYAAIRTECYAMLASLLEQAPSERIIGILQNLDWDDALPGKLDRALRQIRQAACKITRSGIEAEFNRLFVGMGCGEMVPYASWYRERMIQSSPLAALRADLMRLGIVRQPDSHESEDHAGALCEVMALLSRAADGASHAAQAEFFKKHIASWMMRFFKDLRSAKNADFYRDVASFGSCFLEVESEYLNGDVTRQFPIHEGGRRNETRNHRQSADIH
ncbi:MAG: molecular chaperone TorD family protein [Proteobacteria bacterium]|nr:molecular chaperone TorD family protein [Pseudomonadota bacterium]